MADPAIALVSYCFRVCQQQRLRSTRYRSRGARVDGRVVAFESLTVAQEMRACGFFTGCGLIDGYGDCRASLALSHASYATNLRKSVLLRTGALAAQSAQNCAAFLAALGGSVEAATPGCDGNTIQYCGGARTQRFDCTRFGRACVQTGNYDDGAPAFDCGGVPSDAPSHCEGNIAVSSEQGVEIRTDCGRAVCRMDVTRSRVWAVCDPRASCAVAGAAAECRGNARITCVNRYGTGSYVSDVEDCSEYEATCGPNICEVPTSVREREIGCQGTVLTAETAYGQRARFDCASIGLACRSDVGADHSPGCTPR